jgi:hypothetical protein
MPWEPPDDEETSSEAVGTPGSNAPPKHAVPRNEGNSSEAIGTPGSNGTAERAVLIRQIAKEISDACRPVLERQEANDSGLKLVYADAARREVIRVELYRAECILLRDEHAKIPEGMICEVQGEVARERGFKDAKSIRERIVHANAPESLWQRAKEEALQIQGRHKKVNLRNVLKLKPVKELPLDVDDTGGGADDGEGNDDSHDDENENEASGHGRPGVLDGAGDGVAPGENVQIEGIALDVVEDLADLQELVGLARPPVGKAVDGVAVAEVVDRVEAIVERSAKLEGLTKAAVTLARQAYRVVDAADVRLNADIAEVNVQLAEEVVALRERLAKAEAELASRRADDVEFGGEGNAA